MATQAICPCCERLQEAAAVDFTLPVYLLARRNASIASTCWAVCQEPMAEQIRHLRCRSGTRRGLGRRRHDAVDLKGDDGVCSGRHSKVGINGRPSLESAIKRGPELQVWKFVRGGRREALPRVCPGPRSASLRDPSVLSNISSLQAQEIAPEPVILGVRRGVAGSVGSRANSSLDTGGNFSVMERVAPDVSVMERVAFHPLPKRNRRARGWQAQKKTSQDSWPPLPRVELIQKVSTKATCFFGLWDVRLAWVHVAGVLRLNSAAYLHIAN